MFYECVNTNKPRKAKKILRGKNDEEKKFIKEERELNDFKVGLKIPGKLMAKRIQGGVLLVNTDYLMR